MRQLYEACVTSVVDYASTVWHDPLRDKTHLRHLRTVQRAALIRVLFAFRIVATITLDVEAHVQPTLFVCATVHRIPSLDYIPYPKNIPYGAHYVGSREDATIVDRSPGSRYHLSLENNEPGEYHHGVGGILEYRD
jgi:hypothetical protein